MSLLLCLTSASRQSLYMYSFACLHRLRKLALVGLIVYFERGSVTQIMIALLLALGFYSLHMRAWPYKLDSDNRLRATTELHVCLTIGVAMAFRTDLDSSEGSYFGTEAPDALDVYNHDIVARRQAYDWLLITTFIVCVPGMLVVTLVGKFRLIKTTLAASAQAAEAHRDRATVMRFVFNRFRLGLATASESKDLAEYILQDLAVDNEHQRAGCRLWRDNQMASHFTAEQMSALLKRLEDELPNESSLGYHYTDLD